MSPTPRKRTVLTSCSYDCGGRCVLKVRVGPEGIEHVGTERGPGPRLTACARGLAQAEVVRAPDRLREPLRRVGARGEGRFVPISWEEALDTVAGEVRRVADEHGPSSLLLLDSYGSLGALHGTASVARRFFGLLGGCTTRVGNTSLEAAIFASRLTFGAAVTGATRDTFDHSKLLLLWGWNPVVTRFGPDTVHHLKRARESGARVVCVDPRRTPTAERLADEWVPIRPGTDAALLLALCHVLFEEELYDRSFVERCVDGLEPFRDHVLGREDGVPKSPAWAEAITGVPAATASRLAREYATQRPAALCAGWAPGRSAFGEQFHRAAQALSALTGNLGVPGGFVGGGTGILPLGNLAAGLPAPKLQGPTVHGSELYDALLGREGGPDLRLVYVVGSNFVNQLANTSKGAAALARPEFVVAHELFLTPTARHADVVLPVTHFLEREDVAQPWAGGPYLIHMEKALEPLPGTRSDLAIFSELARRLGHPEFNERTDEEWLREFVAATPGIPDLDGLREEGVHRLELPLPWIAFREQVADPVRSPFRTPSGKIELWSRKLAEAADPLLPPIPKYLPPWEGPTEGDPRYPLQLVSPHSRARVNSQLHTVPRLRALADDRVWIHPADAKARGIADGDPVRVRSPRGELCCAARVTRRIMPGVVSLDQGAWYAPEADGVDRGGCVNVLTTDRKSPGGAFTGSTCRVQVERAP